MDRKAGPHGDKTLFRKLLRYIARSERVTVIPFRQATRETSRAETIAEDRTPTMLALEPIKGVDAATLADWIGEGRR